MSRLSGFIAIFLIIGFLHDASAQCGNQDLLDQINANRKERRLPPLGYTTKYQASCDSWAKYMSQHYGHSFYNRRDLSEVISILYSREEIIQNFMDSKPHKKALMDRAAKFVCIGLYQESPGDPIHTCIRTYR